MMGEGPVLAAFNAVATTAADDVSTHPPSPPLILPFLPSFFYSFLPLFIRSFLFLILPSAVTFLFLCETLTSALYDAQRRPAAEAERRGRMTMLSGGKQNTRHSRGQGGEGEVSAMAQLYRWLQSEST